MREGKLVRDKIPELMIAEGKHPHVEVLEEAALGDALRRKLEEEVAEYVESHSVDELADIMEVVLTLAEAHDVTADELERIRRRKREARGGFTERLFLQGAGSGEGEAESASEPEREPEPPSLTLGRLQNDVEELKRAQGWSDLSLDRRAVFLMSEIGEIAKELLALAWSEDQAQERVRERLGMEIYDAVWNLCDLAHLAGVDLEETFAAKREINLRRSW